MVLPQTPVWNPTADEVIPRNDFSRSWYHTLEVTLCLSIRAYRTTDMIVEKEFCYIDRRSVDQTSHITQLYTVNIHQSHEYPLTSVQLWGPRFGAVAGLHIRNPRR